MNSALLFEVAFSVIAQVTLLILLSAALDQKTRSPRTSCRLWTGTFVAILILVLVGFALPHIRWWRFSIACDARSLGSVLRMEIAVIKILAFVWLIGVVVGLVRRCHHFLTLQYFLGIRCRDLRKSELSLIPNEVRQAAPPTTRWCASSTSHGPFCWQMHRPTIVLPTSLLREDELTLRHILNHELEHLRTGHPVRHFLQGLCRLIFWFHPAIRWAARRAELAREFWCDEVAAATNSGIAAYLRSLATIAEQHAAAPQCTLAFERKKNAIVRRCDRLVTLAKSEHWKADRNHPGSSRPVIVMFLTAICISQLWLPLNVLASDRARFSPWPTWTANALYDFEVVVRDYEEFDHRREAHELLHPDD